MRVVAAVLEDANGRVLIAQRPPGKQHAGLWEFPGGKIEAGESAFAALRRELHEELGIEVASAARFMTVRRPRMSGELVLEAWRVSAWTGELAAREHSALEWRSPDDAHLLALCDADQPILRALALPACYAITPAPGANTDDFLACIARGLARGVRLLQWRAPGLASEPFRDIAIELLRLARAHDARLLLNADPGLAIELGAHGVHLSAARMGALAALPDRPSGFLVAASVHDAIELAQAGRLGVDFVTVSPVRATASHPGQVPIGWPGFSDVLDQSGLPAYALGGMVPEDFAEARRFGALGVAGISAFWPALANATTPHRLDA